MSGGAGFCSIRVTADPAEGELLVGLLRSEGIAARLDQVGSALLGAAPQLFKIEVLVPEEDAARARELLEDLEYVGAAEAADRRDAADEAATSAPAPRRPLLGAGLAFLFPGGCHLYAGQVRTAIVVEVGVLACLIVLGSPGWIDADLAFATLFSLLAWDALLGVRAVKTYNRGEHPNNDRQILHGAAILFLALTTGFVVHALRLDPP